MINKRILKSFSISALVAFGLTINCLYSAANAVETPVDTKQLDSSHKTEQDHSHHHGNSMHMDIEGMVMYENKDTIPKDCTAISEDITIKVRAGVKYSEQFPGTVFGFDQHQWQAKPCSRITVEFTNDDDIRHQWMIHGLPKYLYPEGMFHIEVYGSGKKTGTFIVPSSHFTYLVHCDIAQHTEKGMKAQLKVGNGRGDLPSIPGISDPVFPKRLSK